MNFWNAFFVFVRFAEIVWTALNEVGSSTVFYKATIVFIPIQYSSEGKRDHEGSLVPADVETKVIFIYQRGSSDGDMSRKYRKVFGDRFECNRVNVYYIPSLDKKGEL